jgi:protein SCO1/2
VRALAIVAAAATLLLACSRPRQYELRGQIVAIDAAAARVTVKHEDIPGFMPAMTMSFDVRDRRLLEARQPGELVTATLVVDDDRAYLSTITRTGMAAVADAPAPAPVDVLRAGEPVPDAPFTDQSGRARRFSEWRGRVVGVTFMYTRCPMPDFCPLMDRHFREAQGAIGRDPQLSGRARLVSVSFDPEYDTPAVLAAHAARVSADPAIWTMLTGEREQVDRFASRFGVSVVRPDKPAAEIVHNLRTAIIDADGRLVTILSGNEWSPAELLARMRDGLR